MNIIALSCESGWICPYCQGTNTWSGAKYDYCQDCGYYQAY